MQKKVLVIGYGSMAKRLIQILEEINCQIFIYLHRKNLKIKFNLNPVTSLKNLPILDYIIIACPTNKHEFYIKQVLNLKIPIFVEKPISDKISSKLQSIITLIRNEHIFLMIGFNLRFLPIIKMIKKHIQKKQLGKLLFAQFYVGQYLPDWRPQYFNYLSTYSANYQQGGGVALDLIHEIDMALNFFGELPNLRIDSQKLGDLQTDCEDFVEITSRSKSNINITLDCLNHIKTRRYIIVGTKASIYCDIYNHQYIFKNYKGKLTNITNSKYFDTEISYYKEMEYFLSNASKKHLRLTDRELGLDALKIAVKARKYVSRK